MKISDAKEKKFRQLSDEELKQVTGGAGIDCSLDEYKNLPQCFTPDFNLSVNLDFNRVLNPDLNNKVVNMNPDPKYS